MSKEKLTWKIKRWHKRWTRWILSIRRFFTLEARPEDVRLRKIVEQLLNGDIQFMPWRQLEKQLRIGLGKYKAE